ncbi:MAG: hypothetical protein JW940_17225 [Polyangiaceae bacterium]|nr:hypothetical protein [Polyangiaceae bacterium]
MVLVLVPWVALVLFVVALVVRVVSLPAVARKRNARCGGSFPEQLNWWTHKHGRGLFCVLRALDPQAPLPVREHKLSLWRRSFPFHRGLYRGAALRVLFIGSAALAPAGLPMRATESLETVANSMVDVKPGFLGFDQLRNG